MEEKNLAQGLLVTGLCLLMLGTIVKTPLIVLKDGKGSDLLRPQSSRNTMTSTLKGMRTNTCNSRRKRNTTTTQSRMSTAAQEFRL